MAIKEKNLKLDSKKRITLGKLVPDEVTSYAVEFLENGTIILKPRVEIPAEEAWLFKNKNVLESVKRGLEDSAIGKVSKLEKDFWDDIEE
ncbi:MAG: hypothetical protein PHC34_00515 [Candidatus Gastranaerophilales bacterium]|nr:hypothetical protein [Candidatus Gastranaerophilales bacterium]